MKIFFIGFMGSGKTHWGRLVSEKLHIPFFDLDEQIVSQEEKSVTEIFSENGEEYFRLVEKDLLHVIAESNENFVMACGGGTPCYYNNIDYMNITGTTIWINNSFDVLFNRLIGEKGKRPLIRDLTNEQLKAFIIKKFSDRKIYYEQADIIVGDEPVKLEAIVEKIFHA
ncbi:MAG TPA: shikimate kinase [Chitinophagaceae bacterium]